MRRYIGASVKDINDESYETQLAIAKDPDTDPEVLRQLMESPQKNVRFFALRNPSMPVDVLQKYANDGDIRWIHSLTRNPALPKDIIRQIATAYPDDIDTQLCLAALTNTPTDVLDMLYNNATSWPVKSSIVNHPNASAAIKTDYSNFLSNVNSVKENVRKYIKDKLYASLLDNMSQLESTAFEASNVEAEIDGYDVEWCTGEYSEESEELWETALDALVDYELHCLFEHAPH